MRVARHVREQMAEDAVDEPRGRGRLRLSETLQALCLAKPQAALARPYLREGELQLVHTVIAGLVDARGLAGGAAEQAGKQVGQGRVVVPIGEQAAEQVGPAQ